MCRHLWQVSWFQQTKSSSATGDVGTTQKVLGWNTRHLLDAMFAHMYKIHHNELDCGFTTWQNLTLR